MRRLVVALALLGALPAWGQTVEPGDFPVDRLRLASDAGGLLDVEGASLRSERFSWDAGLWLGYISDPLMVGDPDGEDRLAPLVRNRLGADLVGSFSPHSRLTLGLGVRTILYQERPDTLVAGGVTTTLPALSAAGLGDLRLTVKVGLLSAESAGIDLALAPAVVLPAGGGRDYRGESAVAAYPEVALGRSFGRYRLAANLGYLVRRRAELLDLVVDDELQLRLGFGARFGEVRDATEMLASLTLATPGARPFGSANGTSVEVLLGARQAISSRVVLYFVGGAGLAKGFASPDLRILMGARFRTESGRTE